MWSIWSKNECRNIENSNIDNVEENKEEQVRDKTEEVVEEPTNDVPTTDNSEFDSSVAFIGDSRTQAFLMYTGLKNVTDYTNIGLMVDTATTKKFVKSSSGEKVTIIQDLKTKNIDKVYIMLGVNELRLGLQQYIYWQIQSVNRFNKASKTKLWSYCTINNSCNKI